MSILSVDTIQPIGSGTTITLNAAKIVVGTGITFESNGQAIYAGIITASQFVGNIGGNPTFSGDVTFNGGSYDVLWDASDNQLEFGTNAKLSFGASSDLQIHRSGTHSYIKNSSNTLVFNSDAISLTNYAGNSNRIVTAASGEVKLYYSDSVKLETTNTGAVVTGICTATSFSGSGENLTRTTPYSHRNKFINGSFAIWQRGTSSTSTGYLADRWYFGLSGGSATCSRQEHSGSQANFSGSQYYLRLAVTSSSDYIGIRQRIEDVRTLPEGQITVSFWARGHVNGNLAVWMTQGFGSGGSTDVDIAQQVTPYLQNDSTFRYYSLTFTVPSISGKTIGAGSFFQISFGQGTNSSASAWTLDISNIQVEVGSVATPFEHRSFGEELARCQRYFQQVTSPVLSSGYGSADGYSRGSHIYATEMRASPTLTITETSSGNLIAQGGNQQGFYATFGGLSGTGASLFRFTAEAEI